MEKRAYTRVLQGVLDLADAVFPDQMLGRSLDHLGRMSLYRDGMTFGHGVGYVFVNFLLKNFEKIVRTLSSLDMVLAIF